MGRGSGGELLAAEQPHVLQPLVVLNLSGIDGVLQMAVGIPLGVGVPHKGEGGDGVLEAPQELAVGIFTAFCGGPFFVWLLYRKNKYGRM